jgi:protein-tyrosine phosphatase
MHGSAGLGRPGLFRASLARRALGLSGAEAIQGVRHVLPHAVETPEQQRLLLQDEGV